MDWLIVLVPLVPVTLMWGVSRLACRAARDEIKNRDRRDGEGLS